MRQCTLRMNSSAHRWSVRPAPPACGHMPPATRHENGEEPTLGPLGRSLRFRACARAKPEHPSAVEPRPLTTLLVWMSGRRAYAARSPLELPSAPELVVWRFRERSLVGPPGGVRRMQAPGQRRGGRPRRPLALGACARGQPSLAQPSFGFGVYTSRSGGCE